MKETFVFIFCLWESIGWQITANDKFHKSFVSLLYFLLDEQTFYFFFALKKTLFIIQQENTTNLCKPTTTLLLKNHFFYHLSWNYMENKTILLISTFSYLICEIKWRNLYLGNRLFEQYLSDWTEKKRIKHKWEMHSFAVGDFLFD